MLSPAEAAAFVGLGKTRIKQLLRTGAIPFRKDGRRTLILRVDLETFVAGLATERLDIKRGAHGRFASAVQS
jgi:excisionase family DNA binding protein